ncbi:hypothetical protein FACUT_8336 [Fusarium acutatum]|uniref:Uncharacterized protein n=1 Tax=Fusarium acutatum TaxID=78861 RepID=A0A8H4JMW8_9HYPO|nr:hypothetical protein FACUT_8336 [Fusarium acutatum]
MSFNHEDEVHKAFTAECFKEFVLNGNHVDQYEPPKENKSGDIRSLKSQSSELKDSESNNRDSKFQARNDENKTTKAALVVSNLPENLLAQKRKWNGGRLRTRVNMRTAKSAQGVSLFELGFAACTMSSIIVERVTEKARRVC